MSKAVLPVLGRGETIEEEEEEEEEESGMLNQSNGRTERRRQFPNDNTTKQEINNDNGVNVTEALSKGAKEQRGEETITIALRVCVSTKQ
jgi:hypothetical protein